jgi:hypothetical protein
MWCSHILWSFACRHFSLRNKPAYLLEPICRLIVVELPAREVIVTLDSTLMGLALQHASSREYQNVRDDM